MGRRRTFGLKRNGFSSARARRSSFERVCPRILDLEGPAVPLDGPPLPLGVEEIEDPFVETDLRIVAGLAQPPDAARAGGVDGGLLGDLAAKDVSAQLLQAGIGGVDEDQAARLGTAGSSIGANASTQPRPGR